MKTKGERREQKRKAKRKMHFDGAGLRNVQEAIVRKAKEND